MDPRAGLGSLATQAGFRLIRRGVVASTMDEAAQLVQAGEEGRVWVVADRQQDGRGRNGRIWQSPAGNFYATLLLVDPCDVPHGPQLGFVAGLALHDALLSIAPLGPRLRLKWPNDALVDGAKLSGILLEGAWSPPPARRYAVSIGIGVNLKSHPENLSYKATDLTSLGYAIESLALLEPLSDAFVTRLAQWKRGDGFASIREDWTKVAAGRGERIAVESGDSRLEGVFHEIDGQGRLVLETTRGRELIHAGDMTLRNEAA